MDPAESDDNNQQLLPWLGLDTSVLDLMEVDSLHTSLPLAAEDFMTWEPAGKI